MPWRARAEVEASAEPLVTRLQPTSPTTFTPRQSADGTPTPYDLVRWPRWVDCIRSRRLPERGVRHFRGSPRRDPRSRRLAASSVPDAVSLSRRRRRSRLLRPPSWVGSMIARGPTPSCTPRSCSAAAPPESPRPVYRGRRLRHAVDPRSGLDSIETSASSGRPTVCPTSEPSATIASLDSRVRSAHLCPTDYRPSFVLAARRRSAGRPRPRTVAVGNFEDAGGLSTATRTLAGKPVPRRDLAMWSLRGGVLASWRDRGPFPPCSARQRAGCGMGSGGQGERQAFSGWDERDDRVAQRGWPRRRPPEWPTRCRRCAVEALLVEFDPSSAAVLPCATPPLSRSDRDQEVGGGSRTVSTAAREARRVAPSVAAAHALPVAGRPQESTAERALGVSFAPRVPNSWRSVPRFPPSRARSCQPGSGSYLARPDSSTPLPPPSPMHPPAGKAVHRSQARSSPRQARASRR